MSTKSDNAEKVAAIKAILEAAKTELNLIEQICKKDTDIGTNEEVIRAKESLCCLLSPPMSIPKVEGAEITQEQLDEAKAAQAKAEKEAAEAKAEAEKAASEAKAAAAKAAAEIAKAKADAADAAAGAGGDADAVATATAAHTAAIDAAVAAARAAAQVEIDAAIARAEAAEAAAAEPKESEVDDEKLKKAALAAAKQVILDKNSKASFGEGESKEQKIQNYSKKFLPFPKIIKEMTTYIQDQIDPSFKANILANGMVLFTKEPDAASGAPGIVQWGIPAKPADVVGYKPDKLVAGQPGQPAPPAGLATELDAKVKAQRAKVDQSIEALAGESAGAPAAAPAGEPAGQPKESSTAARPAGQPKESSTAARPAGQLKESSTAARPAGQLKESSTAFRRSDAAAPSAKELQRQDAAAKATATAATAARGMKSDAAAPSVEELKKQAAATKAAAKAAEAAKRAKAGIKSDAAVEPKTGGLRRSKRKHTTA